MTNEPKQRRLRWLGFSLAQLATMTIASIPVLLITGAVLATLFGLIPLETMIEFNLEAGEDPGMITFGAMFLASPVQWLTGRSQVRVRKFLGISFFVLALSNGAMFVLETGIGSALSEPFLVAGTLALALALPLFVTSSRRAQRAMGMRRWRSLHKLTYVVAVALLGHVVLIGDIGPGAALIALGFVGRVPAVRKWLSAHEPQLRFWRPKPKAGLVSHSV